MNSNYSFIESFADQQAKKNGKINELYSLNDLKKSPFLFIQEHNQKNKNIAKTALSGLQENNSLAILYYSDENIRRIQKKIKEEVYIRTKKKFKLAEDQDENDLQIAMRAVYFNEAKFLPTNLVRQVKELNKKVVDYVIPDIITNIKQEYGYLRDINESLKPMIRPTNLNNGKQLLPSITSLWEV